MNNLKLVSKPNGKREDTHVYVSTPLGDKQIGGITRIVCEFDTDSFAKVTIEAYLPEAEITFLEKNTEIIVTRTGDLNDE